MNDILCTTNNTRETLYVIQTGKFKMEATSITLREGDVYGELSIVQRSVHTTTLTCTSETSQVYSISRQIFHNCVQSAIQLNLIDKMINLKECDLFTHLDHSTIKRVAESTTCIGPMKKGDIIIQQGDIGTQFFSIKSGKVNVLLGHGKKQKVTTLEKGSYFGEIALLSADTKRTASIICDSEELYCYVLTKRHFDLLLGPIRHIIVQLSNTRKSELLLLSQHQKQTKKTKKTNNNTKNTNSTHENINTADASANCNTRSTKNEVNTKAVSATNITQAIDNVVKRGRKRASLIILKTTDASDTTTKEVSKLSTINLNDFVDLGMLGEGSFGSVRLVSLITNPSKTYALKMISKEIAIETRQKKNITRERELLMLAGWNSTSDTSNNISNNTSNISSNNSLNNSSNNSVQNSSKNPSVVCLHGTTQDSTYLYMLFDVIPGGELAFVIETPPIESLKGKYGGLSSASIPFFTGCIVSLLALLHNKDIAFRDLKPENLLVDVDGYIVVVDFGFAKIVPLNAAQKTFTLCGSAEYLAPEVVTRRGHDLSMDYWVGLICSLTLTQLLLNSY